MEKELTVKMIAIAILIMMLAMLFTKKTLVTETPSQLTQRADIIKTNPTILKEYGKFIFEEEDGTLLLGVRGVILHFKNGDIEVNDDNTVDFRPFKVIDPTPKGGGFRAGEEDRQ